jgi:hypothetical protein
LDEEYGRLPAYALTPFCTPELYETKYFTTYHRLMRAHARPIALAALAVALAGDLLLRGGESRLGITLLVALVAGTAWLIGPRTNPANAPRERTLLLGGMVLAATGLVLRDAEVLYAIDILSVLGMAALAVWRGGGGRVARLQVLDAPRAALLTVLTALLSAPEVLRHAVRPGDRVAVGGEGAAHDQTGHAPAMRTRALAIGMVLAAPPLLLVLVLLSAADHVFGRALTSIGDVFARDGMQHLVTIAVLAWITTGWLRGTLDGPAVVRLPDIRSPGLPFASAGVALYGLMALLTLFLGTQLRVLFGGAAYLRATVGLTVAEYAREGFLQLVVVSGIVLATLVAADWLLTPTDGARRRYRTVGVALMVLVAALLVSAAARLALYVTHFGLSTDRVVATAIMVWVIAALATFSATILRGRRARFAPVMLLVTIGWVALLNAANPEAIVARVNLARAADGNAFDATYHATLSADALPVLRAGAATLPAADCTALAQGLTAAWATRRPARRDWRTLSLPYARAAAAERGAPTGAGCTPPCVSVAACVAASR